MTKPKRSISGFFGRPLSGIRCFYRMYSASQVLSPRLVSGTVCFPQWKYHPKHPKPDWTCHLWFFQGSFSGQKDYFPWQSRLSVSRQATTLQTPALLQQGYFCATLWFQMIPTEISIRRFPSHWINNILCSIEIQAWAWRMGTFHL